jgi:hypothetical protein
MTGSPTYATPIDTVQLAIYLGTLVSSEYTYALLAMINTSRSLTRTAAATANEIPRTDDPTQPNKMMRTVVSIDTEVSGAGVMDVTSFSALDALLASGAPAQFQIAMTVTGGIVYTGQMVVTKLELTGSKHGEIVTCNTTLAQADLLTVSAHA